PSGCLNLVATDTHRLAWKAVPVTGRIEPPADRHYIVPARVLGEVARVLEQEEYTSALVELSFQATQVVFKLPKVVITCRVLEGKFPHYAQFIPENFVSRVCVPAGDLRLALERALLLAREDSRLKTNIVKLTLRGEVLNVRGSAAEVGYLEEQIPVEKEGEDLEIYFNIQYLLDILRVYPREEFQLLFTSDARS
ncbi:MAG: hypothetical protein H5U03_09785, partial [Clostridia bacterium]|nr:hypothetical protein [Clostridia bacterium]